MNKERVKENKRRVKNKKNILIVIILIIVILLIYRIYALFQSEMNGNMEFTKAKWCITVNGTDVTHGVDTNFVIDNITMSEDNHVKSGKIAPGLFGNFMFEINPQDTDVSIKYDIIFPENNAEIKVSEVTEIEEGHALIQTAENIYTGVIPLEKIKLGTTHKINIKIEWINDESKNEEDTILGKDSTHQFQIPIQVHIEQYLGENITSTS